jgi:hypothetical protein
MALAKITFSSFSFQMLQESAVMSVAAKVALANKRKRDDSEISPVNDTNEEKSGDTETKTEEKEKRTDSQTEAETEKVTPESVVRDMLPPPVAIPCTSSSSSQRAKKTVTISIPDKEVKKSGKNQKFEYGNYNRYYGYRNPGACLFPGAVEDSRLYHFRPEWFFGKDVLVIFLSILSHRFLTALESIVYQLAPVKQLLTSHR